MTTPFSVQSATTSSAASQPVDILDLRDCDDSGYSVAWNRGSQQVTVTLFDRGDDVFQRTFEDVDYTEMYHFMTTPRSVAWAVEDDERDGYVREYFQDGYSHVPGIDLMMDFYLADPDSNELIRCFLQIPEHPGDPNVWQAEFTMCLAGLLEATAPLEHLVLS